MMMIALTIAMLNPEDARPAQDPPARQDVRVSQLGPTAAPGATAPAEGEEVAVIETNQGRIVLKFFPEKAPNHVANFKRLAREEFYDGTRFHRVIPEFMIQGGDPNSRMEDRAMHGRGGPEHRIKGEMNDISHTRGILSMARSSDPDSAGSQFFITVADRPHLDAKFDERGERVRGGEGYTVFGQVIEGMDVVDKIVKLPRDRNDNPHDANPAIMETVRIVKWTVSKGGVLGGVVR
jgi:peptidyl-prolyl cis-trans isomerase B (cyclophilin B)